MVGRVDSEGEFSGPNIAYIYPDFRLQLFSLYDDDNNNDKIIIIIIIIIIMWLPLT